MSDEILTMLGVGVALALFMWRINAGMEQRLDKRIDRLADDHRTLVGEISGLRERMGRVEGQMGQVEGRMARVEGQMGQIEGRMARVEGRMERVEGRMEQVDGRMARIEGLIDGFVRRTDPDAPASA